MPRPLPTRRMLRHHLMLHRAHGGTPRPLRNSDLVLAILGVALLGGLGLASACSLVAGAATP